MSAKNKDLIERFCDALWLQEGLSANTLEAYRRDPGRPDPRVSKSGATPLSVFHSHPL